jgi:hypothetical protein
MRNHQRRQQQQQQDQCDQRNYILVVMLPLSGSQVKSARQNSC